MSDLVKRLEKVDGMLETVEAGLIVAYSGMSVSRDLGRPKLRDARQELQETTEQVRESQQAAIELLTELRDKSRNYMPIERICDVIGLLDGSEEGEDDS